MKSAMSFARYFGVPVAVAGLAGALAAAPVQAQQYPAKMVRVIVLFAPGGGSDLTARQFSAKLSEYLGQQFVVDNRRGAGGLIGMEMTAKSPPDGYTLMMMSGSFSATSALRKPAFDPIRNIIPVAEFGITPFVLTVHPSLPPKSVKELIAMAKAKPNALSFASPGVGSITHLATELFLNMTKVNETVPGYDVELWFGAMAPRGTPEPIINTVNAAINKALVQADL